MKTIRLATFALLFALTSGFVDAQEFAFKVLVNKGKNEVKSGAGWQALKVGSGLKSSDEVNITPNSYLGLVHVTGKPLELKKPGKYSVAELSANVGAGTSVLNKYTDFILSSNESKEKRLAATGAVHRGLGKEFPVYLPPVTKNPVVFSDEVLVAWDDKKNAGPFVVELLSVFGDQLAKFETNEGHVKINLADPTLKDEDNISVVVYAKAKPNVKSEQFSLKRLSSADKQRIQPEYKDVSAALKSQTALDYYFEAAFFEQSGLLVDATTAYFKAYELEPSYKGEYEDYLKRAGFKIVKQN
jgi:hypothetical protein